MKASKPKVILWADASCWSFWLCGNDMVFDKRNISSLLQVIYSCTYLLCTYAILQKPDSRDMVAVVCQHLEQLVRECFTHVYG